MLASDCITECDAVRRRPEVEAVEERFRFGGPVLECPGAPAVDRLADARDVASSGAQQVGCVRADRLDIAEREGVCAGSSTALPAYAPVGWAGECPEASACPDDAFANGTDGLQKRRRSAALRHEDGCIDRNRGSRGGRRLTTGACRGAQ